MPAVFFVKDPNKYDLLYEFGRLVKDTLPDIVTMEILKINESLVKNVNRENSSVPLPMISYHLRLMHQVEKKSRSGSLT